MDIRNVTPEEKRGYIDRVNQSFEDIKKTLTTLSIDMESENLTCQSSAVWIGGQLCIWWSDFITQIRAISQKQSTLKDLQTEIKEIVEDDNTTSKSIN